MKISLFLVLILILGAALCPFVPLPCSPPDMEAAPNADTLEVYLCDADTVVTLSWRDYLCGVLAAEIAPDAEPEALKAQAVAAHTYALYLLGKDEPLTDDADACQGYWSDAKMRDTWGDKYAERQSRIAQAVDSVLQEVLLFDGAPILAAYHALSPGKTESAAVVWGKKIAYLPGVSADGDVLSPKLETTVSLQKAAFLNRSAALPGANLKSTNRKWVGKCVASDTGYVRKIRIGDAAFTGEQVRAAFDLPSAFFTLKEAGDSFVFTVRGRGHGVGMSQNSADFMARQGSDYKEILLHFYPGAVLAASDAVY